MLVKHLTVLAGGLALTQAFSLPSLTMPDFASYASKLIRRSGGGGSSGGSGSSGGGGGGSCPPIWSTVSADLTKMFLNTTTGQCTDDARASIRAAFHDAGTWSSKLAAQGQDFGGADGSLILAQEYNRKTIPPSPYHL